MHINQPTTTGHLPNHRRAHGPLPVRMHGNRYINFSIHLRNRASLTTSSTHNSDRVVAFFTGEDGKEGGAADAPRDEEAEVWRRRLSLMGIGMGSG